MVMLLADVVNRLRRQGVMPKAVLYARFSSDNQREASIDAQVRAIRQFADASGIIIVREYVDMARSATSDDRAEFQRMIKDAGRGEFNFVIVHKLDRFARNRSDAVGYRVELARKGVMLTSVLENYDSDTPEGALMEGLSELLAEFYSRNLSREIKKGQKENALSAKHNGGTPPLGYDVDGTTQKLVINEEEAEAVRLIFSMAASYKPYEEILQALNDGGYKTKRGALFVRNSLHDILRNPKYTGQFFYGRIAHSFMGKKAINSHKFNNSEDIITVDDGVPAIISKEEFDKVQLILDKRKQTRNVQNKERYLLTGKVFCGCCGYAYSGNRSFNKRTQYVYVTYRCAGRRKHLAEKCDNPDVNRDLLEKKVLALLSGIIFDPSMIPKLVAKYEKMVKSRMHEKASKLKELNKQIKAVDKKISNIMLAIESGTTTKLLLERLDCLDHEKHVLCTQLAEEESQVYAGGVDTGKLNALFNKAKAMFNSGDLKQTKQLIDMFISRITVNKEDVVVQLNLAPFVVSEDISAIEYTIDRGELRIYKKH